MKKFILVVAVAGMFGACRNNDSKTLGTETTTETKQPVVVQKEVRYVAAPAPAQQPAKKGWSKAAKGTVIGAGSGAIIGAAVSKKRGKGAVIGAAVGAGTGYVIGRGEDKKDGRVK